MTTPLISQSIKDLRNWFALHKRDLEFRKIITPYRVWVSEIMSQQTTAKTIESYFERFIKRFPDIFSLAKAEEEEVLTLWSGLGYYSRAKNMYKTAHIIVKDYNGEFPANLTNLKKLPGIGDYTAGAILCFGFEIEAPMVDTNIKRVFCRLRAKNLSLAQIQKLSLHWASYKDTITSFSPRDTMQSLMELGATLCKIKNPECSLCPLKNLCNSVIKNKNPHDFPKLPPKKRKVSLTEESFLYVIERNTKIEVLLCLTSKRWTKGLWDLPLIEIPSLLKFSPKFNPQKLQIYYQITNHQISRSISIFWLSNKNELLLEKEKVAEYKWVPLEEKAPHIDTLPICSALRKGLKQFLENKKNGEKFLF